MARVSRKNPRIRETVRCCSVKFLCISGNKRERRGFFHRGESIFCKCERGIPPAKREVELRHPQPGRFSTHGCHTCSQWRKIAEPFLIYGFEVNPNCGEWPSISRWGFSWFLWVPQVLCAKTNYQQTLGSKKKLMWMWISYAHSHKAWR